jgi:hypothetical protein
MWKSPPTVHSTLRAYQHAAHLSLIDDAAAVPGEQFARAIRAGRSGGHIGTRDDLGVQGCRRPARTSSFGVSQSVTPFLRLPPTITTFCLMAFRY